MICKRVYVYGYEDIHIHTLNLNQTFPSPGRTPEVRNEKV